MDALIGRVRFVKSSVRLSDCPSPDRPEVAFIGRSNVGKSSLINMLSGRTQLAKVSSTPGKTQCVNHFDVKDHGGSWYLVDLPGYGYAQTGQETREKFLSIIQEYILGRETLYCLFLVVDSRHEPLANDLDFLRWVGEHQVPVAIVLTKGDKLSPTRLQANLEAYRARLAEEWEPVPPLFTTSSLTGAGRKELLEFIGSFTSDTEALPTSRTENCA